MKISVRQASAADVSRLHQLIEASVRGLQAEDYSPLQIEGALKSVYGVDSQLIADRTYLVAEAAEPETNTPAIVGCGGWSKRKTLYGGDQYASREDSLLDPACEAAKIRAFFIDPGWARRGIGSMILEACECAALKAGSAVTSARSALSTASFCTPGIPHSWTLPSRSASWAWMIATSGRSAGTATSSSPVNGQAIGLTRVIGARSVPTSIC